MVSAHVWLQSYSAKSEGQTPGQQVRYLKREGEFKPVAYVKREGEKRKDYTDYVSGGVQNLPSWANDDPNLFFTKAREYESYGRYYAFQVELSLPRELSHDQQMALRQDLMDAVMPDLPALWVKHDKQLENGERHPHVHILFSARKQDGIERDDLQTFKRWERARPDRSGCEKDLLWSNSEGPAQLRYAFADITNYHLEVAGATERVDPRSLKRREIWRKAIGRGGEKPNAEKLAAEQAQAALAWEQRKAFKGLGDVTQIPREEFVLQVRQWTRDIQRGQQLPRVSVQEVQAWQRRDIARREQEIAALEQRQAQYDHALTGKLRAHELFALTNDRTETVKQGLRARLFEDERQPGYRY